jgi:hypothetical protein
MCWTVVTRKLQLEGATPVPASVSAHLREGSAAAAQKLLGSELPSAAEGRAEAYWLCTSPVWQGHRSFSAAQPQPHTGCTDAKFCEVF